VLALTAALIGVAEVSAHRRDEYLQAARLAIDPGRVQLELDLTPGIAVADAIIAAIDGNRDGSLSEDEQRAYGSLVVSALTLEVDAHPLRLQLGTSSFPDTGAMRHGEGTIRLQSTAPFQRLSIGLHRLLFRNRHHSDRSVYLANALVPDSAEVAVTAQRRDRDQRELIIEFVVRRRQPAVSNREPGPCSGQTPSRRSCRGLSVESERRRQQPAALLALIETLRL
jgi:hypothetical protein